MRPLIDVLSVVVGSEVVSSEGGILVASDARAGKLLKEHGLIFSAAVLDEIGALSVPELCACASTRSAYYLGLQMGWRAAQRIL